MNKVKNGEYIIGCDFCGRDMYFGDTSAEGAWAIAHGFKWKRIGTAMHMCTDCQHLTMARR